jgi:protein SCO1
MIWNSISSSRIRKRTVKSRWQCNHKKRAKLVEEYRTLRAFKYGIVKRLLLVAAFSGTLSAHGQQYSADQPSMGQAAQQIPSYLKHTGIEQHLNHPLPLKAVFTDEQRNTAALGHWMGKAPVILVLVYYKCALLCPEVLHGLAAGLKDSGLVPGKDYGVITVSIDPDDSPSDAVAEKAKFVSEVGLSGIDKASHFLTGNQGSIQAISDATGFQFVRVPGPDGRMDQFAHPTVIMFATPDGRLSKYIAGINYQSRDLRLAILDASQHKISNPADLILLYCCSYNPVAGKYSVAILRVLSIGGVITLMVIAVMVWLLTRKPQGRESV